MRPQKRRVAKPVKEEIRSIFGDSIHAVDNGFTNDPTQITRRIEGIFGEDFTFSFCSSRRFGQMLLTENGRRGRDPLF
jgi:hypothetical protein